MSLLAVILLVWLALLVGFLAGVWWHSRPSMDEAYPLERRRPTQAPYPSEWERRRQTYG